ncbi:hypothetical protein M405DRAFT_822423 [Rhizopogon salebrosus TDB-379]|nr:hypothetical protein M405DRAFT_822423 [Rhizopogon salebrosus TDB-379]
MVAALAEGAVVASGMRTTTTPHPIASNYNCHKNHNIQMSMKLLPFTIFAHSGMLICLLPQHEFKEKKNLQRSETRKQVTLSSS